MTPARRVCPEIHGVDTEARELRLVTVYISQGPLGAEVARGKLESLGIPAFIKREALSRVVPVTVDGLGMHEVQVPAAYADQAREALAPQDPHMTDPGED